jgi:hypothetical protein
MSAPGKLATQNTAQGQQQRLGAWEMQALGPSTALLSQKLPFNRISKWFTCTLTSKKQCYRKMLGTQLLWRWKIAKITVRGQPGQK